MSWAGSRRLDIYLGSRGVAMAHGADVELAESASGLAAALATVAARPRVRGRRPGLRVWLSGGLCRPFLLALPPGVRGDVEAEAIAARMAGERTGLTGACRIWLESPQPGGQRVAVAVNAEVLEHIRHELAPVGRIESLRPWWSQALRHALACEPVPSALGVQDCDSLTILIGAAGRLDVATTITPLLDRSSADSALARAALSSNIEPGHEMLVRLGWQVQQATGEARCALWSLAEVSR